jgi:hypothetical protein
VSSIVRWVKLSSSSSSSSSSTRNIPFGAIFFLRRFCQIASSFHFFEFHDSDFFTEQGHQPFFHPSTWRTWSLYLCPPLTGCPSNTLRNRVPFPLPSMTCKATVEVFYEYLTSTRESFSNIWGLILDYMALHSRESYTLHTVDSHSVH